MALRTIENLGDLNGKTVLVRFDFNVPLDGESITDEGRIAAAVPTIASLLAAGAAVVGMSHLGRPKGEPEAQYSLAPVAKRLGELISAPVKLAADTVGPDATAQRANLKPGELLLLENLRFDARETSKDDAERAEFSALLAAGADFFISDGFGVVHRKQASVYDVASLLPSAAGPIVQHEVEVLSRLMESPAKPYTVVLGGSKVSDKLGVIEHLLPRVQALLIGGGMAFTFLKAQGHAVGASLLEEDQLETVRGYLERAKELGVDIVLPTDIVMAASFAADAEHEVAQADALEQTALGAAALGLDIGPESTKEFAERIAGSATVFWNGPMGVFEMPAFANGTKGVAAALSGAGGFTVVGGGDSAAAVRTLGFEDTDFSHISTGGGASLELLEGKRLPGLEALGW